jgi:hypothetical protein
MKLLQVVLLEKGGWGGFVSNDLLAAVIIG